MPLCCKSKIFNINIISVYYGPIQTWYIVENNSVLGCFVETIVKCSLGYLEEDNSALGYHVQDKSALGYLVQDNSPLEYLVEDNLEVGYLVEDNSALRYHVEDNSVLGYPVEDILEA